MQLAAVAVIGWVGIAFLVALSLRLLQGVCVRSARSGEGTSSLSVVLAVHNEISRIRGCLESILRQDHPMFELVVVDDRSSDGTLAEARKCVTGDPRVRLVQVDAIPAGWQGRLYAQSVGVSHSTGKWILFLSSDQRLATSQFLRDMVAEYERGGAEAVSVIGRFVGRRWWQRWWLHPMVNNPILWGPVLLLKHLRPNTVWLIGALAMRRATYADIGGGHAAAICGAGAYDDFGWSRAFELRCANTAMVYHSALEDHSNWDTFSEFWYGVTRWAAGLFTYRKGGWITAACCAAVIILGIYGTARLLSDVMSFGSPDLGTLALALIAPTIGVGYCRWDNRGWPLALLMWLVGFLVLAVLVSAAMARVRNRVRWRAQELRIVADTPAIGVNSNSVKLGRPTLEASNDSCTPSSRVIEQQSPQ